ncbi:ABC transporter permease [Pedococcus bigeumensis]|uniref:ABC transporter permease n=1 Tax=Pedococcus bigeumensis TaxID=433644 RepID=A0A502CYS8_9MICO|nr:ABC transporter permease [Pedococcus bigeumensis]TPG17309.1 ABC transporter permease [Pedococcus bigeumensis]
MISGLIDWLTDSANWSGSDGVVARTVEHLWYSGISLFVACLIAIPLGLAIGHTGRGRFFVVNLAGAARAIPSLGLLYVMVLWLFPKLVGDSAFLVPSLIVLIVLAIPPLMAGAYAGVEGVDPAARDAAKGMGMTGGQVLAKVEVPNALPLIFSGFRSATLQVIATATLAAVAGTGGLGRFLIDGQKVRDYPQMASGALLVAVLALVVDLLLAVVQRYAVSPGLTGRGSGRPAEGGGVRRSSRRSNTPLDVEIVSSQRTVDSQHT